MTTPVATLEPGTGAAPAPERDCPACGGSACAEVPDYSPAPWRIVTCDACGFVYLKNPPGYEALVEDFAWERTYAERDAERKKKHGRLRSANRALKAWLRRLKGDANARFAGMFGPGRVLDIGCGDGRRIGPPMTPYGIELSAALHARADERMRGLGGYCVHAPGAEGLAAFQDGFFDGVLMHSYLEHEAAPLTALTGAFRVLRPGGKVFVRVPNYASLNRHIAGAGWCGFRYPDHVNYFTLASLTAMAAKAGFSTRLVNRLNLWVDDNIHALLTKPTTA